MVAAIMCGTVNFNLSSQDGFDMWVDTFQNHLQTIIHQIILMDLIVGHLVMLYNNNIKS